MKVLNRVADRLLGLALPQVTAKAAPCACSPGTSSWGSHCYCSGIREYRRWNTCSSNCRTITYYCRYSGNTCV